MIGYAMFSGLICWMAGFLLIRGLWIHRWSDIVVGLVVLIFWPIISLAIYKEVK